MKQLVFGTFLLFLFLSGCKKQFITPSDNNSPADTLFISIHRDTSICVFPHKAVVVDISVSTPGAKYSWIPVSSQNFIEDTVPAKIFTYSSQAIYYYTIKIDSGNTTDTFRLSIDPCNPTMFLPNSFTPNSDGMDDTWYPKGMSIQNIYFKIRNLKGKVLFKSLDINNGWNGRYKNKTVPIGKYLLYMEWTYTDNSWHQVSGEIQLVR